MRFNREAPALVGLNGGGPSLGEFLDTAATPRVREPADRAAGLRGVVGRPERMWDFPASMLAEFFANHGMFGLSGRPNWLTITGGSDRYVEAIIRPLGRRLRLSTPVRWVERRDDRVEITPAGGELERFDEVIFAAHSNQALRMLADTTRAEAEVLGAIPYQRNEAVLHTDRSLLPRRRRAWASWNFHLRDEPAGGTTVTYHMNRLQSLRAGQRAVRDAQPDRGDRPGDA